MSELLSFSDGDNSYSFDLIDYYDLRLGLKSIQVQLVKNLINPAGQEVMGSSNASIGVVLVDLNPKYPKREVVDTFIHECMHLLSVQMGWNFTEEQIITHTAVIQALILDSEFSNNELMYNKIIKGGANAKHKQGMVRTERGKKDKDTKKMSILS